MYLVKMNGNDLNYYQLKTGLRMILIEYREIKESHFSVFFKGANPVLLRN